VGFSERTVPTLSFIKKIYIKKRVDLLSHNVNLFAGQEHPDETKKSYEKKQQQGKGENEKRRFKPV
jgi:hypothetical protein